MNSPHDPNISSGRALFHWVAIATLGTSILSGCLLNTKKSHRGRGASELIVRDSIYLDRIGDGAAFRLQFKTTASAVCELAYYSQEANVLPTKEKPIIVPCSAQNKPRLEFTERIDNIVANTLYFITITAWNPSRGKTSAQTLTVRESASNSGDGSPSTTDGNLQSLYIARLNIPLKVAEVYKNNFPKSLPLAEIKKSLQRPEGCQVQDFKGTLPFRDGSPNLDLANLATRDLATASATQHPDYPQRLSLQYSSLNTGMDKWSILYQSKGRDILVPIRPVASFSSLVMSSTQTFNFDAKDVADAAEPFKIEGTAPLKIVWTSSSQLLPLSYVTVQIGYPITQKFIYCVFPAEKGAASIEAQVLASLPSDKYMMTVELVSNLLFPKENWLVATYDWRSTRIEK